jgi:hypothetical protein
MLIAVVLLNFQVDPFISYTIIMAKLIGELGSSGQASAYISGTLQGWQGSTSLLLQNVYGAGVLLAILHLISDGSIIQLTYLPVPGILSMCMVYLILRRLSKLVDPYLRSANLVFSAIAILSMYSYMSDIVVGRFYAFDFHAINNALYLMCLYFIIRLSEPKSNSSYFLTFIIAFSASNTIHYTVPVVLIGDLAAYTVFSWFVSRGSKIGRLALLLVAISSLQSFYFSILNTVNSLQVSTDLLQYFSGGFLGFGPTVATQATALAYMHQVQILLAKAYTYSSVIFVVGISAALLRIRGRGETKPISAAYSLTVGGGIAYFLAYFANYGYGRFGFVDGWLLQPLLIVTVAMILAGQRREARTTVDTRSTAVFHGFGINDSGISTAGAKDSRPRKLRRLMLAALLIVALLQAGSITLSTNERLFHGPMVSEPGLESASLQSFSITHLSGGRFLIGASSEVSSALYSHLADYNAHQVLTVIPAYIHGNSTFTSNTLLTYAQLRNNFNYLILTNYELSNGLYGGATRAQSWEYLNATEVTNLRAVLNSSQNIVCNSGDAYLYAFH